MSTYRDHHRLVDQFFGVARSRDADGYDELEDEHPSLTYEEWKRAHQREVCVGLLGLDDEIAIKQSTNE